MCIFLSGSKVIKGFKRSNLFTSSAHSMIVSSRPFPRLHLSDSDSINRLTLYNQLLLNWMLFTYCIIAFKFVFYLSTLSRSCTYQIVIATGCYCNAITCNPPTFLNQLILNTVLFLFSYFSLPLPSRSLAIIKQWLQSVHSLL